MHNKLKKPIRSFGNELQNNFNFLNNQNNIKKVQNKEGLDNSTKLVKKVQLFQNNLNKRNTMFMKLSNYQLQNKKNNYKISINNLYEIKEEENNASTRLTVLPSQTNAITKGALNKNKIKNETDEKRDYFHSLLYDYGEDIFKNIKKEEKLNILDYSSVDIFKLQDKKYFNEKNRGIIFQWLIKNNYNWKLNDDTIFMAMNIMDRYISKYKVENSEFQLIGITSYFIASKFEDIYPQYLDELSKICNFIYTPDDIIKKEYEILSGLNFDILYNSSYKFLTFLHSICDKENMILFYLAQFILELTLENLEILKFTQCKRAMAALLLAKKIMKIKKSWNDVKLFYNYNENEIKIIQKKMIILLNNVIKNKTKNAVFQKFESSRYKSVSSLLENMCHNPSNIKQKNNDENKENRKDINNDENKPDN